VVDEESGGPDGHQQQRGRNQRSIPEDEELDDKQNEEDEEDESD